MKVSINKLIFISFFLIIIISPINYKLISFVRPVDILLIFFPLLLFVKAKIKFDYLVLIIAPITIILFSTLLSFSEYKDQFLGSSVYLYKLIIIYLVIMGTIHVCESQKEHMLNKLLFSLFIFLIIYSFIYSTMVYFDILIGNKRISYPFTVYEDRLRSDAHLYGNYLVLNLIVYVLYWMKKFGHNLIISLIIQLFCIAALFLTGSKNPLLILFIFYMGLLSIYIYQNILLKINLWSALYLFVFFVTMYLFTIIFDDQIEFLYLLITDFIYLNQYHLLVTRIYYFILNPFIDDSALGRINNLIYALKISEPYYFIFGKGLNGEFRFFDGIHSIIISLGGFSLLLVLIINIAYIVGKIINIKIVNNIQIIFFIFLFFVIFSNLITEFIFVTRWMVPIISISTLLYLSCFENNRKMTYRA